MFHKLKKFFPIFLLVGASVKLYSMDGLSLNNRVDDIENKIREIKCIKLPLQSRCSDCFIFGVDFLYWKAENPGYSFAFDRFVPSETPGGQSYISGSIKSVKHEWDPGFRIKLGFIPNYDFIHLFARFTYFKSSSIKSLTATDFTDETGLMNIKVYQGVYFFNYAEAKYGIRYRSGDLLMNRGFKLTRCIDIFPHWGVTINWIDQTFWSRFKDSPEFRRNWPNEIIIKSKSDYFGAGPKLGADISWNLCRGFNLSSNLSGAVLYGKLNYISDGYQSPVNDKFGPVEPTGIHRTTFYDLIPTIQMALGADYVNCFRDNCIFLKLSLLWEINYFWDQYYTEFREARPLQRNPIPGVSKSLSTKGLTVKFELNF